MFVIRRNRFGLLLCCLLALAFIHFLQLDKFFDLSDKDLRGQQGFLIIWWTPFIAGEKYLQCGEVTCLVSDSRSVYEGHICAFLFYGTNFNKTDLPLPRNDTVWALLHEESPRNSPLLNHESILGLFNFSSTFSRYSDFPLTFQYLPSLESITSLDSFKSFDQKSNSGFAPVVYIQSDCVTPNNRDSYVSELMKFIDVDSYGSCLKNKELPDNLKNGVKTMMSPDLLSLIGNYKFAIAFENALCEDYITEKLWRPLIVGSIPLYIGSSSVKDWLPNEDSVILPQEFSSPKDLANYLNYLSKNSTAYNKYLKHKLKSQISNKFLIKRYKAYRDYARKDTIIEEFECAICRKLHKNEHGRMDKKHFNCYEPVSIVNNKYNNSNWWHYDYFVSKCEADLLRSYIDKDIPLKEMKFNC